jgi:hypothetical protein
MKELEETNNTLQQAGKDVRTTINTTFEGAVTPTEDVKSESQSKDNV